MRKFKRAAYLITIFPIIAMLIAWKKILGQQYFAATIWGDHCRAWREIGFMCRKCGKACDVASIKFGAICEDCCEDHMYEYDDWERSSFCKYCYKRISDDYYDE